MTLEPHSYVQTAGGKDDDLGFDPDSPDVNDPATDPPHPPPIDNPAHHPNKQQEPPQQG